MDFLQGIDPGFAAFVALGCALLCVVGLVLLFVLQVATGLFEIIFGIIGAIGGILGSGPCGCLVVIFGCGVCGLITIGLATIIPQCNTPDAVNFCRLLGY